MIRPLIFLSCVVLFFASCCEQTPGGLVLNPLVSIDTTYIVTQIETPQQKNVVIEELTGAACTNCPAGTLILKGFQAQYPGRIILTGIHSGFLTEPPAGALYDFRNADADALKLFFNEGDPGKPSATFDRIPVSVGGQSPTYFILKGSTGGDWIATLPGLLAKTTPVNIHLTSDYNAAENKVNVVVKIHFIQDVTENLGLTLYVLENGRIDKQEDKDVGEIPDYKFDHILRKIITPVAGDPLLDSLSTKIQGRVVEKSLMFTPDITGVNGWNLDSCLVIGIIHKTGASREIIHAEEIHLK